MGRDYSEGKLSPMVLPKRPCLEERRPMDAGAAGCGGGEVGSTSGRIGGGGGGRIICDDVLFYVGKRRQVYNVSAESLIRGSAYFRNLLERNSGPRCAGGAGARVAVAQLPPIVMDCEESVFENMLLLIRYGTWEALPRMSEAEIYRLKKEVEFYGVQYMEAPPPPQPPLSRTPSAATLARSNSSDLSVVSTSSPASSPGGSPKSETEMARPPACRHSSGRFHEGVRLVGRTSRQLAELPDFPLDLSDPAKLLLVACVDEEKAPIYACSYCSAPPSSRGGGARGAPTQWALSFHHRHAFCTSCGRTPANMSARHFAEMFTAAAAHYQSTPIEQAPIKPQAAWWVGSDSTCMLRFVSSAGSGPDGCRSARCGASTEADTIWAATFFYSHAFCTRCGEPAPGAALLSLLLALRYGGASNKKAARSIPAPPAADVLVS